MINRNLTFTPKTYQLQNLINDIDTGNIALPDLQRPFVWDTKKARDLIDSLYKGLPVGFIILWEILEANSFKKINQDNKRDPRFLVIDGQQRLTSLFSIIKNKEIISKSVHKFKIKISFNPIEEKFEVYNAAIEKSKEWIPDISRIFENSSSFELISEYLAKIKDLNTDIDSNLIAQRIEKVRNILNYPFQVLELSTDLDPEEVSEIFVRINSKGQSLNQSDFILTLMSVYWPEGREKLERFYKESYKIPQDNKPSSYNIIGIKPTPEQLIRTIVGYSFDRGRLKYAYLILKGRDLENRTISAELREKNFNIFKSGQEKVLNLTNWHDFIKIIHSAGFIDESLISSKVAFFITYAFYLKLLEEKQSENKRIESLVKKWFVFSILTQRYTGSPESKIEEDFNKIKDVGVESFINTTIETYLTNDFWDVVLPEQLESSSTRNFAYLTYLASLIYDDAKILFSDIKLRDYLKPQFRSPKKTIDLHHIYPRNYLKKEFNLKQKEYNQVANFVYIEYKDNIKISDKEPAVYWPEFVKGLTEEEINKIYETYSLPMDFPDMEYFDFLKERRKLMAKKIKDYFYSL
jgi:hypothetical protein